MIFKSIASPRLVDLSLHLRNFSSHPLDSTKRRAVTHAAHGVASHRREKQQRMRAMDASWRHRRTPSWARRRCLLARQSQQTAVFHVRSITHLLRVSVISIGIISLKVPSTSHHRSPIHSAQLQPCRRIQRRMPHFLDKRARITIPSLMTLPPCARFESLLAP